ncbi:MAG TPA: isoprenylcysteine carboxylmethyltransferase family protein [Vicinamibacteria bacterium]|jgi:protein-S-isoprenylcysteine O-methyltransferase Ste14|nr:isoprenylcysteine carboxylmethyltransferase family protein [Vicinamibacteria bacterium]
MDFASQRQWINALWILFGLYWSVSAFKSKKTTKRESWSERFRYLLMLAVASALLSPPGAHYRWFGARFVPASNTTAWIGVLLTAAGVAIAFWARWHLGANWSGVVTIKEGHELIRSGPYHSIRHPIYTGILVAILGTAVAIGEVRGLLAVAIAWLSFYLKARREESFLGQEFGDRFAEHRRHTGMFLPPLS